MSSETYTVSGHKYQVANIPVVDQIKIVKRLMPVLTPIMRATMNGSVGTDQSNGDMIANALDAVATLKDEDLEYITNRCLSAVSREQEGGNWANVWNARVSRPTFDDVKLRTILELVKIVIQDQLGDFLPEGRSTSSDPAPIRTSMP